MPPALTAGRAGGWAGAGSLAPTADVLLAVDGEMNLLAGFAQMTFLCAAIGGLLLAVLTRR